MGSERPVTVRCGTCRGAGNGFLPTGQWTNKCIACGGEGTVLATLSDPAAEALMEWGKAAIALEEVAAAHPTRRDRKCHPDVTAASMRLVYAQRAVRALRATPPQGIPIHGNCPACSGLGGRSTSGGAVLIQCETCQGTGHVDTTPTGKDGLQVEPHGYPPASRAPEDGRGVGG